jgi:hypothetical protein
LRRVKVSAQLDAPAFDSDFYRVGRPERNVIKIERNEEVELINALQILDANQRLSHSW